MLQIIRLDNDFIEKVNLHLGNNIIGRGVATGSDDESVVKRAFTINLAPNDEMTITPALPCYMKSRESSRWQLLKSGVTVPIKPGDICSLLPRKCWFKIISMADNMSSPSSPLQAGIKRKANEELADPNTDTADKKSRIESQADVDHNSNESVVESLMNNETEQSGSEVQTESNSKKEEEIIPVLESGKESVHDITSGNESCSTTVLQQENLEICENVDPECNEGAQGDSQAGQQSQSLNSAPSETAGSGEVSKPVWREKCKYKDKCYRQNPAHKIKYSHPGDADYDIPDDREECCYGKKCYRKSAQHRAQFKHTSKKPGGQKVSLRKRLNDRTNQGNLSQGDDFSEDSAEESVDESDYEPSSESRDNSEDEQYSSGIEWEDETVV